ncbi:MAG: hypothetical protein DWI24_01060 [Planctomycetota bacterium]|nr:MAG: hypothetical protein DWI24_01060 [Planctomycetota bacterium]
MVKHRFIYFETDLADSGNYIGLDRLKITASVVPEPSTYTLDGIALAVLAAIRQLRFSSEK